MTTSLPPAPLARPLVGPADLPGRVWRMALVWLALSLVGNIFVIIFGLRAQIWRDPVELFASGMWVLFTPLCAVSAWLAWRGSARFAAWLLLGGLLVTLPLTALLVSGLGLVTGLGLILLVAILRPVIGLSETEMPRVTAVSVIAGIATVAIDFYGPAKRVAPPTVIANAVPVIVGLLLAVYGYFSLRDFRTFSLRNKLVVAFLGVTLSALSVLAVVTINNTRTALLTAANNSLSAGATETANRLDDFINSNLDIISTAAQFPALGEYLSLPAANRTGSVIEGEVIKFMFSLRNRSGGETSGRTTYLQSYSLLDKNGFIVLDTETQSVGKNLSDRDYFSRPFLEGLPFVSPVEFEPPVGERLFFAAQVSGVGVEPVGVLAARYGGGVLQRIIVESNNLLGEHSSALLIDENHFILGNGEEPDLESRFKSVVPLPPEVVSTLQQGGRMPARPLEELALNLPALEQGLNQIDFEPNFSGEFHQREGIEQASAVRLKTQPWFVVFEKTQSALLQPIEEQTRNAILLAVALAGLAAAAAVWVAQLLTEPITRLTTTAQTVTSGNFNARAPVTTPDEIGALATAFNTMTAQLQQTLGGLEQRVAERTAQLQAAAEIGRATTSMRDLDELLRVALQLIRERFGVYHASIFLMDAAGAYAVLRESTGEVGAQLKARGHKLALGSKSLIGWVTQNRHPRAALDTADDPFHFKNPLLPDTRSELAIPLIVGNRLLGALDVQSTHPNAFPENSVQVLQTLADLLSVAIENAELFQRTQASLQEMQQRYQQVTGGGLRSLIEAHQNEIVYQLQPEETLDASAAAPPMLLIPLRLRGEVVGALELHGGQVGALGVEERAVLDTVATQLSVALESAVLFEETQRRSRREQLINQIADQMRTSLNPVTIMQNGIRELGKALGATEVVVQFHPTNAPSSLTPEDKSA